MTQVARQAIGPISVRPCADPFANTAGAFEKVHLSPKLTPITAAAGLLRRCTVAPTMTQVAFEVQSTPS